MGDLLHFPRKTPQCDIDDCPIPAEFTNGKYGKHCAYHTTALINAIHRHPAGKARTDKEQ